MEFLAGSLLELITQTSTNLPPDVRAAMSIAANDETPGTQSSQALDIILTNVDMATDDVGPICQDTGMPTFVIHTPVGVNQIKIRKAILEAVAEATRLGKLRPNSVDSLTGKNSGNNLGEETPVIHFDQWENDDIEALAQIARVDVGIGNALVGKLEIFEQPARPAFVDGGDVAFVECDARSFLSGAPGIDAIGRGLLKFERFCRH